ncbi:anthrone oxygenase family protein [Pseudonocardia sp. GCM10023141]|uniref:anthrone oxygenase family protein n=1 Tax=Pseudonocardia sp. GCM10023141 TaxID=3252653 RepID=UPI003611A68F
MGVAVLQFVGLFLAGILAGEEFIVCYGIQPALSTLADRSHILARQALIRRLWVVVPTIMIPTVVAGIAVLVVSGTGPGIASRWATVIALVAFVLFSFLGTVPINIQVDAWSVDRPPDDWKSEIRRWQRIDVFRSGAAILAFAFALVAVAFTTR